MSCKAYFLHFLHFMHSLTCRGQVHIQKNWGFLKKACTASFLALLLCSALAASGVHLPTKGDMVNTWLSHGANSKIRKHKLATPTHS